MSDAPSSYQPPATAIHPIPHCHGDAPHHPYLQHHFDDMDLPPAFISGKGNIPSVPYNSPEEMAFYPTSKDIEAVLIKVARA